MHQRLEQLRAALPEELDGALITSEVNRRYYLGFPSTAGTLLVTRKQAYFLVDSRYVEGARSTIRGCRVILQKKLCEQLLELLGECGVRRLALESEAVTLRQHKTLCEKLENVELDTGDALSDAIAGQRQIKDAGELDLIARAQDIADKTLAHILGYIRPGRTEREIALEMEFYSRSQGSEGEAFPFIILAGANTSRPHAPPSDYAVQSGDFVLMDFGCRVGGYCSDMTRTVAVGSPGKKQRRAYQTVLEAQRAALEQIRPGARCAQVDQCAREFIDATGFAGRFTHSLGHSLGLEIHETPTFSPGCETVLEPGFVLSVEPGIYLLGEFGVRIEDLVAVTDTGAHNLTASPKELICL